VDKLLQACWDPFKLLSSVGRRQENDYLSNSRFYFGYNAQSLKHGLTVSNPIRNGKVAIWDENHGGHIAEEERDFGFSCFHYP
jgi:hypothetical protein